MATVTDPLPPPVFPVAQTVAELIDHLGVPGERIRLMPPPGYATEDDAASSKERYGTLCELVDGVLVEKPMGYYESWLAVLLSSEMMVYMKSNDLGMILGADGTVRTGPRRVRMPDVAFYSWARFPGRVLPAGGVLSVPIDLAVEILSPSNTVREMDEKRREYFAAGTSLYWECNPETRTVRVYTAVEAFTLLSENDTLTGEPVLPGFRLPIRDWFARAGNRG